MKGIAMKLRGINFGKVWGAAGVQGVFGEGYPHYHIPFRKPDFTDMTFISKSAPLYPRDGNVKKNGGIREKFSPSWAKVQFFSGQMLNAMGLPSRGIKAVLMEGKWQQRKEPFFISIAAVENTLERRLDELRQIIDIIGEHKNEFSTDVGLQVNRSCPNTEHHINIGKIVEESLRGLEIARSLGWPLTEKYAIDTAPVEAIKELQFNPNCDGICASNSVKFGWSGINWKKEWGTDKSPLAHLGDGGLSGPKLLPHVCAWIKRLRDAGFEKHINGGGGIFSCEAADAYFQAGADSIFIGTVATMRPGRVGGIIRHANQLKR